jgi:hypothetical protein
MPLLKELRGFSKHRGNKHHAPDSARCYRASESRNSAPTPALLIRFCVICGFTSPRFLRGPKMANVK